MVYSFDLNLIPGGVPELVKLSQYDYSVPELQFTLWDGNQAYTIPSGSVCYVVGTKPDNTGFQYTCSYSGSVVTVEVTEQMTAVAGRVPCEIVIMKDDGRKGSANFFLDVEPCAMRSDVTPSETDIPIIERLPEIIAELEQTVYEAEEWAVGPSGSGTEEPSDTNNSYYWHNQSKLWAVGPHGSGESSPSATNNAYYWAMRAASAAGGGLQPVVVQTLPTTDISTSTLYFVPSQNPTASNYYDEYINLDGTTQGWECIGTTAIDMSNYYTKAETKALIVYPHFIITADTGSTVTATKGQTVITATETSTGVYECDVTDYGTWVVGGKNLLPLSLESGTVRGITFNVSDGVVSVSGTATGEIGRGTGGKLFEGSLPTGSYTLTDSYSGTIAGNCDIFYRINNGSSTRLGTNGSANISLQSTDTLYVWIYIENGVAISGTLKFYPMIRLASIEDSTFEPYIADPVDVTVDDVKIYNVSLREDVPEGSTVTPTDDVQTLLNCANIWDKDYTTLTELLADTTTLASVINSNNAIDYLVRSKTWVTDTCANSNAMSYIGLNNYASNTLLADSGSGNWLEGICNSTYFESVLNVKVPTMTSNTTPSGEAFYDFINYTNPAYMAFDGDYSTYVVNNGTSTQRTCHIGYEFTSAVPIYIVEWRANPLGTTLPPASMKLQGSTSKNGTYENLSDSIVPVADINTHRQMIISANPLYKAYRLECLDRRYGNDYYTEFSEIQFYGREDV